MKHYFQLAFIATCLTIAPSCQEEHYSDTRFSVYEHTGEMASKFSFTKTGGKQNLHLYSGTDWSAEPADKWITITPDNGKGGKKSSLEITVTANRQQNARFSQINFMTKGEVRHTIKIEQAGQTENLPDLPATPIADILDISFQEDGSAINASDKFGLQIETVAGAEMMVYNNADWKRNVAHFNHLPGENTASGYFKADYTGNTNVIQALEDGHSMEIVFCSSSKPDGSKELKMFSSHEQGGTGFLISKDNHGNCITFLPNISTNGRSNWIWTTSGIVPEAGKYYHVIGVWDKEKEKSFIYVNGELKGSAPAAGSLVLPKSDCLWFGIGVDASANSGQGAWAGDIVYAKVYDAALTAEEVKAIYQEEHCEITSAPFDLKDVEYLQDCQIPNGYRYHIYANGFKKDDQIILRGAKHPEEKTNCDTRIENWGASVRFPHDMKSGEYKMFALRNQTEHPIGMVRIDIVSDDKNLRHTECVAHRCYHENGSQDKTYPENSLAAFKRTQELGIWGAEIDVWITRDGEVVVNHNATVPTDPKNRRLEDSYYADLQDIRLSNGEALPTLSSFLKQMKARPGLKLVLEIKTHSKLEDNQRVVDKCVQMVKDAGLEDQVTWIAFSYSSCMRIAEQLPKAIVSYLGGDQSPKRCFSDGIKGIDYEKGRLKDSWIKEAHELGMSVNVWTINDQESMMKFIAKGADFITTNDPDALKKLLEKPFISKQ